MRLAEDRRQPGGRDELEYPKPWISLQVATSTALYPLNGVMRLSPECQPSTTGGTGHPYLAVGKGRRWEKLLLQRRYA